MEVEGGVDRSKEGEEGTPKMTKNGGMKKETTQYAGRSNSETHHRTTQPP